MIHARLVRSFLLALTASAIACSSGPDIGGGPTADGRPTAADGGPTADGGSVAKDTVSAATGGTIRIEAATLTIPAGALATDTAITAQATPAASYPEAASLQGKGYDFGPSGLTFSKPATLTIELPAGVTDARLALLDEATRTWVPLADSKLTGSAVSGSIAHFSSYALVVRRGNAELTADFSDCAPQHSSAEGWYADTCGPTAAKGIINRVKLAGTVGTPSAGNSCIVSYSDGLLSIVTDLIDPATGGPVTFTTKFDNEREDNLVASGDKNGSPIRYLHLREEVPGLDAKVYRAFIWISEERGLTYAYASGKIGTISCGSDPRATP